MDEWTVTTLKEHIEKILDERETALRRAIDKADERLSETLRGFPQEYGRKDEVQQVREMLDKVRTDHVRRDEFDVLKDNQSQGRGAKLAIGAVSGVVIALVSVTLAVMYARQLTPHEVSSQIITEAPWVTDKPGIDERIRLLEQQIIVLKSNLSAHEVEDRLRDAKKG